MVSAVNEADLYKQLQSAGLELIGCTKLKSRKGGAVLTFGKKVKIRDLIQFFIHIDQMQGAGVPLLDALADIRDTTESQQLRDIVSEICRDVSDGSSLSEAMNKHPKVFNNLYISLIRAAEDTGDMTSSYRQLVRYLKWVDEMRSKIKKATRYPMIVSGVVVLAVVIMMGFVVPQIVGFIRNLDQELPWYTMALIATSDFFKQNWMYILGFPVVTIIALKFLCKVSDAVAYQVDMAVLSLPMMGPLVRKINIARYAQTFGALFASGIDVIGGLRSARNTVHNRVMVEALKMVEQRVAQGSPLSEALNISGEFPSMVVRMVKIGEESGNLSAVLEQISEFYTKDVDEAVTGLIAMIEPALTGIMGGMILWIAAAVFGPIYNSFENIDF